MGWFLFLVLCFLLSHFPSHTSSLVPLCNHDDASALLSFKTSFSLKCSSYFSLRCESPYPKTESWKIGTNCCLWDGVSCDTKSGHVTGLDLSCSCLQGEFDPNTTLFKLVYLQTLNLAYNDFFLSPMPSGFGDLVSLTHLNLSTSEFFGVIPSKISHLSKLVSLDFSDAYYGMTFEPATLEKLIVNATDLRELTLDFLDMSLIKPSSLSLLVNFSSSLVSLSLPGTKLHEKLANTILCLPNLQKLDLSANYYLEGELPKFNWSTPLRYLNISSTAFSGKISNSINHLKSLNYLNLHYAHFEGLVLLFLSNLTQLKYLDLGGNNFSGELSLSFSSLQDLTYIDLSGNNFIGPVPQSFGNITLLNHLDLSSNNFSDEIPLFLFNIQHLTHLDLSYSNFGGEIPDLFGKLSKLEYLDLSRNNLVGRLPSSLFGLTQLNFLSCSDNKLVGSIPDKISGLSNLGYLDLSGNSLPHWCFSLSSFWYLFLGENQLTGPICEFSAFSLVICDFSFVNS